MIDWSNITFFSLFNVYAFNNYNLTNLCDLFKINFNINIKKGEKSNVTPIYQNDLILPLTMQEKQNITVKKHCKETIIAPITVNENLGQIDFMLNGVLLGSVNIISKNKIERLNYIAYYKNILTNFFNINYLY